MIGFIGYGNMSKAMIEGLVDAKVFDEEYIIVSGRNDNQLTAARALGIITTSGNKKVAAQSDVLIICVKPHQYEEVIKEIEPYLQKHTIVVSIAAGLTLSTLASYFHQPVKLMRTMPNTPAKVGAGMTALIPNEHMTENDVAKVRRIFDAFSRTEMVEESLIDAAIATSGSAPAYLYMMLDAMIAGGMAAGMDRKQATAFTTQAMIGAAKMVAASDQDPEALVEAVCSPNGTTIEAVNTLREANFKAIVMEAMAACVARSKEMAAGG